MENKNLLLHLKNYFIYLLIIFGFPAYSLATTVLLEPEDGKVYHGVQTMTFAETADPLEGYLTAISDSTIQPAVRGLFFSIPGERGPANTLKGLINFFHIADSVGFIPELSLFFVSNIATDSIIAVSNQYDWILDSIITLCKDYNRKMFLRIGGEFNGAGPGWNGGGYHPYYYVTMFRKIVNMFESRGFRDSIATNWCYEPDAANDFDSVDGRGARWYPGDEYVDWFGLDVFQSAHFDQSLPDGTGRNITKKGKSERFLKMAREKDKPVFLSETSAHGINISSDNQDGINDWNNWFAKFFEFIDVHQEIKGYCYIDANWPVGAYPGWGDARIENSTYVTNKYIEEMKKSKYIHLKTSITPPTELPEKVSLVSPSNNSELTQDTVLLIWQTSKDSVLNYRLDISFDSRFINIELTDSTITDTTFLFVNLREGNSCFWRVQAKNSAGWGPYSDVWKFSRKSDDTVSTTATVIFDFDERFQTIEGWGASSNFFEERIGELSDSTRAVLFDLIYKDLGFNILCIRLYSDFQTEKDGIYNWDIMETQRMIVNEAVSRGNIDFIWLKVSSPPGWMKDNNSASNGGHVKSEHYQDYAEYLSYYISHMKSDYGITINAVSIFNEPGYKDTYETTETTAEEYNDISKIVAQHFKDNGLDDVLLIGPESGNIKLNHDYFSLLMNDSESKDNIKRFTTHQYGDQLLLYGTGPGDDWLWLKQLAESNNKQIWETEVFVGGSTLATKDIDEGLKATLLWWNAVTTGNVSAWHYWQYAQPENPLENKSPGIIGIGRNDSLTIAPRYYCMKHWGNNISKGDYRIESLSDNKNVYVAAFLEDWVLKVIAFNMTDKDISTKFTIPELVAMYDAGHIRTAENENYVELENITLNEDEFETIIKSKSVNTFIIPFADIGVQERKSSSDFSIIPNPASEYIEIKLSESSKLSESYQIKINNILGECVMKSSLPSPLGEGQGVRLDVSDLPNGIYTVVIQNNKEIINGKFVIIR